MALRAGDQLVGGRQWGARECGRWRRLVLPAACCCGSNCGGVRLAVPVAAGGAHRGLGLFEGASCEPCAPPAIAPAVLGGPGRLAAVSELLRTGGIRLYNKNRALRRSMRDVDAMWFLLSALTVKVKRLNQAQVNSGSNYDSLKVAKCLVI